MYKIYIHKEKNFFRVFLVIFIYTCTSIVMQAKYIYYIPKRIAVYTAIILDIYCKNEAYLQYITG